MTRTTYDFTGTDGSNITQTSLGTGSVVSLGAGTAIYSSAAASSGATGARITNAAGTDALIRLPLAGTASTQLSGSVMVRAVSGASANNAVILPRFASGFTCFFYITTTGAIEFWRTSTNFEATVLPAASVVAGTYYRITFVINSATGVYTIKIYNGPTSTTPLNTVSNAAAVAGGAAGAVFNSTAAFTTVQLQAGGVSTAKTLDFDTLILDDGSSTEIVPGANVPPSLTLSANQNVAAGATVTATATATDSDGSIASLAWSVVSAASTSSPALTGASTSSVSFTAPAAGNLVTLQCTATDNSGGTTTATTEVRVPLTGSTAAKPLALNGSGGGWTNTGGAASDGAALSDGSDTTYLDSGAVSATETARRVRLQPMNARGDYQLTPQRFATDTGTANLTFRLYEGTTLRQSWTQAITSTPTTYAFTLSLATIAAIGDWGNLYVEAAVTS